MELNQADLRAFDGRSTQIDRDARDRLAYIGNYRRALSSNLARMMENAYDWEHLPFVHPGSFAEIAVIDQGAWGWRCKTALPNQAGEQLVELLVDRPNHYWATTIVGGVGAGVQIHTRASEGAGGGIEVDVGFYLPDPPADEAQGRAMVAMLSAQYNTLYDEDEALMRGRQDALDAKRDLASHAWPDAIDLGPVDRLDRAEVYSARLSSGEFAVRWHENRWIAHAAVCPHMLGPLSAGEIGQDGRVACPWHGYRFSLIDGTEQEGRCRALARPPRVINVNGHLFVKV